MPKEKTKVAVPKKAKPQVQVPPKKDKPHFFPRGLIWYALLMIIASLNSYFSWLDIPDLVYSILILIAGLWMLNIGMSKGFYKQRRSKIMKYI